MKKSSQRSVPSVTSHPGLHITPDKISLTIASRQTVKKHIEVPLEPDIIDKGELEQPEKFTQILQQLLKQASLSDKFITLGIPEHIAFIRSFKLKHQTTAETQDRIAIEIEHELPYPIDQLYLDWRWVPESSELIQVAAVPKTALDKYFAALNSAGVIPLAVETSSLTLSRLASPVKQPTLVIDADTTSTLIVINPNQSINLSVVSQSPTGGQLSQDLSQVIKDLISYYAKKYRQEIKQILYTGSLQDQLSGVLPPDIPAEPIKTNAKLPPAQVVGYSLTQIPTNPPEDDRTINLIPPHVQYDYSQSSSHQLKRHLLFISVIFLIILNLIGGGFLFLTARSSASTSEPLQEEQTSGLDTLNQINIINQQAVSAVQISRQKQTFSQVVEQLFTTLPPELTINYIKLEASTQMVTLRGFAPHQEDILKLKQLLEENPLFIQVSLPLSVLEKSQDINFSLSFKWKTD